MCVYISLLICKSFTRCKRSTQTHLIANDTVLRFKFQHRHRKAEEHYNPLQALNPTFHINTLLSFPFDSSCAHPSVQSSKITRCFNITQLTILPWSKRDSKTPLALQSLSIKHRCLRSMTRCLLSGVIHNFQLYKEPFTALRHLKNGWKLLS